MPGVPGFFGADVHGIASCVEATVRVTDPLASKWRNDRWKRDEAAVEDVEVP